MTDSTGQRLEDRKDRYVRGELTAEEARELAQKSLGDPELFEDLTFSALAKSALADPSVAERQQRSGAKLVDRAQCVG